jgi:polyhydroxyalkanoate synthase subunit PhaC
VTCDKFLVGGTTDHITPWEGAYQSVSIYGGNNEFVLCEAGHVQTIINPPGNPKARFMTNKGDHSTPETYLAGAATHQGSWWPYWAEWLGTRGGEMVSAPKKPGSTKYKPLAPAPGTYVLEGN